MFLDSLLHDFACFYFKLEDGVSGVNYASWRKVSFIASIEGCLGGERSVTGVNGCKCSPWL